MSNPKCYQCGLGLKATFNIEYKRVEDNVGGFKLVAFNTDISFYGHPRGRDMFCSLRCGMDYAVASVLCMEK